MRNRIFMVALIAVGLLLTPATPADLQDCINQCIADFEVDRMACLQGFQSCLGDVATTFNDCMAAAGSDPFAQFACFQQSNIGQEACERDADRCQSVANTAAYDCYRTCQASWLNP